MSNIDSDCVICLEKNNEDPLICGHRIHISCIKKHFKPECPLCRRKLNIKVNGLTPMAFVPSNYEDSLVNSINYEIRDELEEEDNETPTEDEIIDDFLMKSTRNFHENYDRYNECEESESEANDEEYDEENPHGDEFEYEDL